MEALQLPTEEEQQVAKEGKEALDRISGKHRNPSDPIEIGLEGETEHVTLPASAFKFLTTILDLMAQGKAITIIPSDTEITTQQAADMLNVSRPYVVKLIEQGDISHHMVGTHRRIKLEDLEAYKSKMEKERSMALEELTKQSQELGLDY